MTGMTEKETRDQLVSLGESLFNRGYSVGGAGNITVRLPDGNLLATPTNSCLGRLDPAVLSKTDMRGNHLDGAKPTKELPLHLAVYAEKPECNAVVHLHSTYVTALSCLADIDAGDALRAFTPYYVMKVGILPVAPYFKPGHPSLGKWAAQLVKKTSVFLLANHGSVVCGASLLDAVNNAEELEETAKLYFILHGQNRPVRYLTDAEVTELKK
ncbi:MAG: 3-oxo-tetronate 4-phosphate decarboxylase [Desulfovibrio sp.]